MLDLHYVSWEEDGGWLGYLEEYPDYWTQGDSLDDLLEHLKASKLTQNRVFGIGLTSVT